jgi:hypothetical protein
MNFIFIKTVFLSPFTPRLRHIIRNVREENVNKIFINFEGRYDSHFSWSG